MGERKPDQKVDAFSASRGLLRAAQLEAKKRGWSKSGFYRYCLAKELGYSDPEAVKLIEHANVGNFSVTEEEPSARVAETPSSNQQQQQQQIRYGTKTPRK